LKIPSQFGIAGHVVRVRYRRMRDDDGAYDDATKTIWLNSALKKSPPSHHFQVFAHELNHALFAHVGRDDLLYDETLVDSMAHLMVQALEAIVVANRR
jgi:Zn-dependent peptidase ImmA (M78 family)